MQIQIHKYANSNTKMKICPHYSCGPPCTRPAEQVQISTTGVLASTCLNFNALYKLACTSVYFCVACTRVQDYTELICTMDPVAER